MGRAPLPVVGLAVLCLAGAGLAVIASGRGWDPVVGEIAGAVVSGGIVGTVLLWYEEVLERRRDARESSFAEQQERRDEWSAFLLQVGLQDDLSELAFVDRDLHGAFLARKRIRNADFSRSNLRQTYLAFSDLSDSVLTGADLTQARAYKADLSGSDLTGCTLYRARFLETNLSGCTLRDADLRDAVLADADLRGADLTGADLTGAVLDGARTDDATRWPADRTPEEGGGGRDGSG